MDENDIATAMGIRNINGYQAHYDSSLKYEHHARMNYESRGVSKAK